MEDKILCYSELSAEERLEVEQYVQQHPEMQPLLEEAKAFTALLGEAQLLRADPPGDDALAYYIATRNVSPHTLPEPISEAFAGLEQHLTDDTALRSRYAELVHRMTVLEATSDPVDQFERLSGRRLARPQPEPPETDGLEAVQPKPARHAVIHRVWWQVGRWAVAVLFFGIAVYGSLGVVSHVSQSDLERLAVFPASTFQAQDLQMRSTEPVPNYASSDKLHARALSLLQEARTHTLGLFPHYDQATLNEAADLLQRIIDQEEPTSSLRSEAYFLMAKVRLAKKNVDGAKVALHAVLNGSGWKATEAQALLDELNALSN